MLVTFTCKVYADITYFGDVAQRLLNMMGHSGTVPGAILAEDVPKALELLKGAIAAVKAASEDSSGEGPTEDGEWKEAPVTLVHRALPLIELLTAAAKENCNVMWRRN